MTVRGHFLALPVLVSACTSRMGYESEGGAVEVRRTRDSDTTVCGMLCQPRRFDAGLAEGNSRAFDGKEFEPLLAHLSSGTATDSDEGLVAHYAGTDLPDGIANTIDDDLYMTETWVGTLPDTGAATFELPVGNGSYVVHLHLADWHLRDTHVAGDRLFHVDLEGTRVLTDFDIIGVADGGKDKAVRRSFPVTVEDGALTLDLTTTKYFAAIAAIEILPPGMPPLALENDGMTCDDGIANQGEEGIDCGGPCASCFAQRFNAGATATTAFDGKNFAPLLPMLTAGLAANSDEGFDVATGGIANTTFDDLYNDEVWVGQLGAPAGGFATFTFPLADGDYTVHLHFADWHPTHTANPGDRQFHVDLEGVRVLDAFDIIAESGGEDAAVLRSFDVTVTGGQLTMTISNVVYHGCIQAIEILSPGVLPLQVDEP